MDQNVYLVDSGWLSKVLLTSHRKDINDSSDIIKINEAQTHYSQGNETQINFFTCQENEAIATETHNDLQSYIQVDDDGTRVILPCIEDGHFIVNPIREPFDRSFISCETFVAEIDSHDPLESSEISTTKTGVGQNFHRFNNTPRPPTSSTPLLNRTRPGRYQYPRVGQTCSILSNGNNETEYSNERYSLYSERGSKLRHSWRTDKATVTIIHPKIFKRQLLDASDTIAPPSMMPSTKKGMEILGWSIKKVFTEPNRKVCSQLASKHTRNCLTRQMPDMQSIADIGLMPIGFKPPVNTTRITRKRRIPRSSPRPRTSQQTKSEHSGTQTIINCQDTEQQVEVYTDPEGQQIIVLHQDYEETPNKTSMEVLLAAAAEGQALDSETLYFCPDLTQSQIIIDHNQQDMNKSDSSPIILFKSYKNTKEVLPI